jgi:CheY-like chemotaxis protein
MDGSVLIVDDDPDFFGLARRILEPLGLVVTAEAATAAGAIATAEALQVAAALVDVGLPDGDGIALARYLTSLTWQPRVVLTSSDPDAACDSDVRRSGASAFVPKDELPNAPLRQLLAAD